MLAIFSSCCSKARVQQIMNLKTYLRSPVKYKAFTGHSARSLSLNRLPSISSRSTESRQHQLRLHNYTFCIQTVCNYISATADTVSFLFIFIIFFLFHLVFLTSTRVYSRFQRFSLAEEKISLTKQKRFFLQSQSQWSFLFVFFEHFSSFYFIFYLDDHQNWWPRKIMGKIYDPIKWM